MNIVSRRVLYGTLAILVAGAILTATLEAALVSRAVGPIIGALLGIVLLPTLVQGARSGRMQTRTVWIVATVGCILCATTTIGLVPGDFNFVSISWYTCGVLAGTVMVWMAGHRLPPLIVVTFLVIHVSIWAGPTGTIRLGLAGEIVLVIAGLVMHRAVCHVTEVTQLAAATQRAMMLRQAELNAFHLERQKRLSVAGRDAAPMLRRIISAGGELDEASRAECRVLEQTLRDEIRGRRLLNDAVRSVILTHRKRGALVQVLDDGGLDDLTPSALDVLLNDVAHRLEPLRSSRIVIRTAQPPSAAAITIVASTASETALALGPDGNDEVEYWGAVPWPSPVAVSA